MGHKNIYIDSLHRVISLIITFGVLVTKVSTIRPCLKFNITEDLQISPGQLHNESSENVTLSCKNTSLALIGQPVRRCLSQGLWEAPLPVCNLIHCPILVAPPGGTLIMEYKNTSLIAQFSCDYSRILIGQQMITCTKDGSWSDDPPSCLIECGSPPSLENAFISFNCSLPNCQTLYSCEEGYILDGNDTRTCTDNGTWSEVTQSCEQITEITCSWPDLPIGPGNFTTSIPSSGDRFLFNTTLRYSCGPHSVLVGDPTLWCGPTGQWMGGTADCVKVSTPVSNASSNVTLPSASNFNSTASLTTTTASTTTATTTRGPPKHCPHPPMLKNGSQKRYGPNVHYKCDSGFILEGSHEIKCRRNGTWSGISPKCLVAEKEEEMLSTLKPFLWKQIFIDHKKWVGHYGYRQGDYHFQFNVQSVQLDYNGPILGMFSEEQGSKFEVKGYKEADDIIFQIESIHRASLRIRNTDWYVRGKLEEGVCSWKYEGKITSSTEGFTTLSMEAYLEEMLNDPLCIHDRQMTLIIVGVCVAIVMVILVALVAYYCSKRKGGFRSSGHRSLTSFENPVYEYEHSLK